MNSFTHYLQKNGYIEKSIQRTVYCAEHYESWLQSVNLKTAEADYKDLLHYIGHLQKQKKSKSVINTHLRNLSLYHRYLQIPDIAYQVRVKGEQREHTLMLGSEELDKLYHAYESSAEKGYCRHSDKILLGLAIYQALDEGDIARLEIQHLDMKGGKLHVPGGSKRKAARILSLEAHQILPLHHYIENHRDKGSEKLFSPQAEQTGKLHEQFKGINKRMRKVAEESGISAMRLQQLRQSRITLWVKQYGLRKAQYYAGFRRVKNAERYRQMDTEDLRQYVIQFHPLQ